MQESKKVEIRKGQDGVITVKYGQFRKSIDAKDLNPEEKFEAIRWVILDFGAVFSRRVEKMARKNAGF